MEQRSHKKRNWQADYQEMERKGLPGQYGSDGPESMTEATCKKILMALARSAKRAEEGKPQSRSFFRWVNRVDRAYSQGVAPHSEVLVDEMLAEGVSLNEGMREIAHARRPQVLPPIDVPYSPEEERLS